MTAYLFWGSNASWLAAALILFLGVPPAFAEAQDVPAVAAAADLAYALPEVAAAFKTATGREIKLTFGSSGNFATQIQEGAPFQLFLSADEQYVTKIAAAGLTDGEGALYAIGRIGLFAPTGSPLKVDGELKDLGAALKDGRVVKFAIANPEHSPYGRAAQSALEHARLWELAEPKLVLGENVSQATQFATSGSAQGGIIPLSLARAPAIASLGTFALIAESWHAPLRQRMVLIKGAGATARAFYDFVQTPQSRAILRRYGFVLPGETG